MRTKIMALESSPTFKHAIADPISRKALLGIGRKISFVPSMNRSLNRGETERFSSPRPSSIWINGNYHSLPEVPMFYPIERTSTVVSCYDPRGIANRILGCLQKLSITAKFNASEVSWQSPLSFFSTVVSHYLLIHLFALYFIRRVLSLPRLLITQSVMFGCTKSANEF